MCEGGGAEWREGPGNFLHNDIYFLFKIMASSHYARVLLSSLWISVNVIDWLLHLFTSSTFNVISISLLLGSFSLSLQRVACYCHCMCSLKLAMLPENSKVLIMVHVSEPIPIV